MLEDMEIDCERISQIIDAEEIIVINELITDPENFETPEMWESGQKLTDAGIGGPEFDVDREEDYHQVRSPGIIETLVEIMLPMECRQNRNVLWLTTVIIGEIAQNQAFSEGNKRTAYMTGALFLIKCQLMEIDEAVYPMLDKELTDKISDLAVEKTDNKSVNKEKFYNYLKQNLCD